MKIAMFTDSYTPYVSGVVRSIQRFTSGLMALGHQVYVFAPGYGREARRIPPPSEGTRIYRFYSVPAPTCPGFSLAIPFSFKAESLVRQKRIDVIHAHSPFLMGSLGAALARKHRIPLVFTHHTLYHEYTHYVPAPKTITRQMIITILQRYCRQCDHIITPTPLVKDIITDLYQTTTPITPVPTGIPVHSYAFADAQWLHRRCGIPPQAKILLFVGRLSKEKNPLLVLEAFSLLSRRLTGVHLVFVGSGPEKPSLEERARTRSLAERVHFAGRLSAEEVIHSYKSAHLFLFGSVTETQGLVTVEAMAGGTPVVAVDATGTSDMVVHGYNGFLTEPSAESLALHAQQVLEDPGLHQAFSANALRTAQQYSVENTSRKLVHIYETLQTNHLWR